MAVSALGEGEIITLDWISGEIALSVSSYLQVRVGKGFHEFNNPRRSAVLEKWLKIIEKIYGRKLAVLWLQLGRIRSRYIASRVVLTG